MRFFIYILPFLVLIVTVLAYKSCALELQPPEVPPRPLLHELKESLNYKLKTYANEDIRIGGVEDKKKNFLYASSLKDVIMQKNFDNYQGKVFSINVNKLFNLLLNTIKLLELSLEYIDVASYEIIAKDNFKNLFFIQVTEYNNKTMLKIFGYSGSNFKKGLLINNMKKIFSHVSES